MNFFLFIAAILSPIIASAEVVQTTKGPVRGTAVGNTEAFKGIPYAAPPVGALRFVAPQEHEVWSEPRDSKYGNKCLQFPLTSVARDVIGNEDCLFLNVWKPSNAKNLPVMVFIHGGGNVFGSTNESFFGYETYDGEYLASHGPVVVVSMNYRLGALGFMAHPALSKETRYGGSGNYGLLDQIQALRWVRENIEAFGGDPQNVTLFGESAGAIDTLVLLASPQAKGLFQKAIVESGFIGELPLAAAEASGEKIAAALGCKDADCLRAKSGAEILRAADTGGPERLTAAVPTIDGNVLQEGVLSSYRNGRNSTVPLIIGSNADEMTTLGKYVAGTDKILTEQQFQSAVKDYYGAAADSLFKLYPVAAYSSPRRAIEDLIGDDAVHCPARRVSRAMRTFAPVWRYVFTHVSDNPVLAPNGAFHALELFYVFHSYVPGMLSPREISFSEKISRYWLNFAKSSNPNGEGLTPWALDQNEQYMKLDLSSSEERGYHNEKCDFFDSIYGI